MRLTILFLMTVFCFTNINAQNEEAYDVIDLDIELGTSVFKGDLSEGNTMPLKWAENSSVACFPGTRFMEFKGNHVLYRMEMPKNSSLKITVIPKNKKARTNIYALRLGENNGSLPPHISSAISCEASYPLFVGSPNPNLRAKPQSVEYISINRPYTIVIGVAGIKDVLAGEYELQIELIER